jgi:chromate transporter
MRQQTSLTDIARLFLRLGTTAFGGPAVHIAMMEEEVVRRRGWLTRDQFLDYLGATNLIPGPNSTELAIHIGYARAGWPGLFVAGASFILPAAAIVVVIAAAYVAYGTLPQVAAILYGIKPVVIAVVAQALWGLGRTAVKTGALALLAVAAIIAVATGVNELVVLIACGGIYAIIRAASRSQHSSIGAMIVPFGLWPLFLVFMKIGAVLFGSGYVLFAFLRADLVQRLGWLTEQQLLDAVAVGQITPGPVFTTATFIGYVLGGPAGAAIATIGIFLPAFVFVALSTRIVPRLRRSPTAGAVLDGVNVASLALMVVVTWQLGRVALPDVLTVGIAAVSLFALVHLRINSAWLVVAGAVVGWIAAS